MKTIRKAIKLLLSEAQARLRTAYFTLTSIIDHIKGLIGIIAISVLISSHLNAISIFDGLYKKIDDNSQKTFQLAGEVSAIKNLDASIVDKIDNMHFDLKAQLNAQAQAQAQAIAGVNNKIHTNTAGRDQTQTTTQTNDTELMKQLIRSYKFIINVLIVQLCALLCLFIKKDWDMGKRMLKIIGDEAEREDKGDKVKWVK